MERMLRYCLEVSFGFVVLPPPISNKSVCQVMAQDGDSTHEFVRWLVSIIMDLSVQFIV